MWWRVTVFTSQPSSEPTTSCSTPTRRHWTCPWGTWLRSCPALGCPALILYNITGTMLWLHRIFEVETFDFYWIYHNPDGTSQLFLLKSMYADFSNHCFIVRSYQSFRETDNLFRRDYQDSLPRLESCMVSTRFSHIDPGRWNVNMWLSWRNQDQTHGLYQS